MTTDQPSPDDGIESDTNAGSAPVAGASRITTGRIITWVLIAALAAVTGLEAVAKFGYDSSLKALTLNMDATDLGMELTAIDPHISGWTTRRTAENGHIVIRWVSLLKPKDYEIRLKPDPQQQGRIGSFQSKHAEEKKLPPASLPEGVIIPGLPPNPTAAPSPGGGGGFGDAPSPLPPADKDQPAPGRSEKPKSDKQPTDN